MVNCQEGMLGLDYSDSLLAMFSYGQNEWCSCHICGPRVAAGFALYGGAVPPPRLYEDALAWAASLYDLGSALVATICLCTECGNPGDWLCNTCSTCTDCCSCIFCSRCTRRYQGMACRLCDRCETCCNCVMCEDCGEPTDDWCSECHRCGECGCSCVDDDVYSPDQARRQYRPMEYGISVEDGEAAAGHFDERMLLVHMRTSRSMMFHQPSRKQMKINPLRRPVAVEIEVAALSNVEGGPGVDGVVKKWGGSIVGDGSLPPSGFEINTAPAGGDLWIQQIAEICEALRVGRAVITDQCGLHCHVDCRDYSYYDMRRLILLYGRIEPALFSLVPPDRRISSYCYPCAWRYMHGVIDNKLPKQNKERVALNVYGSTDVTHNRTARHHEARYRALNIHSWYYRGTVECRLFAGTVDFEKIVNWGMLWGGIVQYAYSTPERRLAALPNVFDMSEEAAIDFGMNLLTDKCAPTKSVASWVMSRQQRFGHDLDNCVCVDVDEAA